jgi:hypothetical protein
MTDDALAREMRQWEAADLSGPLAAVPCPHCGGTGRVVDEGTTAEGVEFRTEGPCRCQPAVDVPNATANAGASAPVIERDIDGNPFPGANQPPHICRTCAEWGGPDRLLRMDWGDCAYLTARRDEVGYEIPGVGLPGDFGCRWHWRAKEDAQ